MKASFSSKCCLNLNLLNLEKFNQGTNRNSYTICIKHKKYVDVIPLHFCNICIIDAKHSPDIIIESFELLAFVLIKMKKKTKWFFIFVCSNGDYVSNFIPEEDYVHTNIFMHLYALCVKYSKYFIAVNSLPSFHIVSKSLYMKPVKHPHILFDALMWILFVFLFTLHLK